MECALKGFSRRDGAGCGLLKGLSIGVDLSRKERPVSIVESFPQIGEVFHMFQRRFVCRTTDDYAQDFFAILALD